MQYPVCPYASNLRPPHAEAHPRRQSHAEHRKCCLQYARSDKVTNVTDRKTNDTSAVVSPHLPFCGSGSTTRTLSMFARSAPSGCSCTGPKRLTSSRFAAASPRQQLEAASLVNTVRLLRSGSACLRNIGEQADTHPRKVRRHKPHQD